MAQYKIRNESAIRLSTNGEKAKNMKETYSTQQLTES